MRKMLLIVMLLWVSLAGAETIYVGFDDIAQYRQIQDGIDAAKDGDVVVVLDGIYAEARDHNMGFGGRKITVRSANGPSRCIIDCQGTPERPSRAFTLFFPNTSLVLEGFTITEGVISETALYQSGGAIFCANAELTIRNCIFAGNTAPKGGAISISECQPLIENCTFVDNEATEGGALFCGANSRAELTNCIFWGDSATKGPEIAMQFTGIGSRLTVRHCNLAGDKAGIWGAEVGRAELNWITPGNITADPCFADPNAERGGGVLALGDYHLKSEAGRWDAGGRQWVQDDVYSPCIDAGRRGETWSRETWPHSFRVNLGAYGGTAEASRSPDILTSLLDPNDPNDPAHPARPYLNLRADLNGDWLVDDNDLEVLDSYWQLEARPLAADFDESGQVDALDREFLLARWQPEALLPESPLPLTATWDQEPVGVSKEGTPEKVVMSAAHAFSTDGTGVEYWFEDADSSRFINSGWLSFPLNQIPAWEDDFQLKAGESYTYHFKTRNVLNKIESSWSPGIEVVFPPNTGPLPSPMEWEVEPKAEPGGVIIMKATTATSDFGVEYRFECTSHPALSSPWQASRDYQVKVTTEATYTFRVAARDQSSNKNQNTPSIPVAVPVDLTPPEPSPMEWAEDGEPRLYNPGPGSFNWRITMTAVEATDDGSSVRYFFECLSDSRYSKWLDSPTYDFKIGTARALNFRVIAADSAGNQTEPSPAAAASL